MHHQCIGSGAHQLVHIQAKQIEIFMLAGDFAPLHTFCLQPQHHNNIGIFNAGFQIGMNRHAKLVNPGWQQRRGADKMHIRAQRPQKIQVRACHTAIGNISANCNFQPGYPAAFALDGQRIQKRLRGMFVAAITCINNTGINMLAQ